MTFAMSERRPAYPARTHDMHEDEDEDDQPLVQPASRKEPVEERRDHPVDDEDLVHLVPPRQPPAAPARKRKGSPVLQDRTRDSRERAEDALILDKKADGEALRNIISKLSE